MTERIATLVGWAILGFMVMLVIAAVITQRRGSLDDLPAEVIKKAVDG